MADDVWEGVPDEVFTYPRDGAQQQQAAAQDVWEPSFLAELGGALGDNLAGWTGFEYEWAVYCLQRALADNRIPRPVFDDYRQAAEQAHQDGDVESLQAIGEVARNWGVDGKVYPTTWQGVMDAAGGAVGAAVVQAARQTLNAAAAAAGELPWWSWLLVVGAVALYWETHKRA